MSTARRCRSGWRRRTRGGPWAWGESTGILTSLYRIAGVYTSGPGTGEIVGPVTVPGITCTAPVVPQPSLVAAYVAVGAHAGWHTFRRNGFWQPADGNSTIALAVKISSLFMIRISSTKRLLECRQGCGSSNSTSRLRISNFAAIIFKHRSQFASLRRRDAKLFAGVRICQACLLDSSTPPVNNHSRPFEPANAWRYYRPECVSSCAPSCPHTNSPFCHCPGGGQPWFAFSFCGRTCRRSGLPINRRLAARAGPRLHAFRCRDPRTKCGW